MYPYNHKRGQTIQTNCDGVAVDRSFIAHFQVPAAKATVKSNVSVLAATALTAEVQAIVEGFTQPSVPRNIIIKGNAAGVVGDVTIKGTNYNDEAITEVIALNEATAVEGVIAFKTITEVDLPVEVNAGTDTVSIGTGEILGLPYLLKHNTVIATFLNNAAEAAPVVVTDAADIEKNTIDLATALSSKIIDVYLIV